MFCYYYSSFSIQHFHGKKLLTTHIFGNEIIMWSYVLFTIVNKFSFLFRPLLLVTPSFRPLLHFRSPIGSFFDSKDYLQNEKKVNKTNSLTTKKITKSIPNCWICHEINQWTDSIVPQFPK